MHRPSVLPQFLCLLVVVVHTHCVLGHGAELLQKLQSSKCAESPVEHNPPCDNESGCICKGATLADKVDATPTQDDLAVWMRLGHVETFFFLAPPPGRDSCRPPEPPPPASGTAARALLQSFQI